MDNTVSNECVNRIPDFLSDRARAAAQTALKAGSILLSYYDRSDIKIKGKGQNDLVTEADTTTEAMIRRELLELFPEDGFIGEESDDADLSHRYTWVADPLDGTVNFSHAHTDYAVSIACIRDGQPIAGAVYVPCVDILFVSEVGKGVYKNGQRVFVSQKQSLKEALLGMDFAYRSYISLPEHLSLYQRVISLVLGVVMPESAVMTTAYACCGRFDAVLEQCLYIWDIAATILFLREAGAAVTDRFGEEIVLDKILPYSVAAACPEVHRQLVEATRDIPRDFKD